MNNNNVSPVGEWTDWENGPSAGVAFRYRDAIVSGAVVPRYYREVRLSGDALEGDICPYCGTNNGRDGEYRNGCDCYYCGSN